jgi:hypothetical protein
VQPKPEKIKNLEQEISPAGNFCLWDTSVTFDFPSSAGYGESGSGNMVYYFLSPSPVEEPEK